jgi:PadR family transcriptional regulator, regulatory protein PadR
MAGSSKRQRSRDAVRRAVEQSGGVEAAVAPPKRPSDPFAGELRRREVLPLLVLHLIKEGPSYGNQLMERIAAMTAGVLSVNPNTMYPLLRQLEGRGLIEGRWEHPERRSRRFYRITPAGEEERARLAAELGPRLDRIARSIDALRAEVLG